MKNFKKNIILLLCAFFYFVLSAFLLSLLSYSVFYDGGCLRCLTLGYFVIEVLNENAQDFAMGV